MSTKKLTDKTSYSYSKIKWTKSDVARLNNAVRSFNKEVKKHYGEIDEKFLPKLKNYQKLKSEIYSRKDLELAISTMKKIKNKNAFKLVESKVNPNVKFTNWEYQTAKRYDYRNQVKLQTEYNKVLNSISESDTRVEADIYGNPIRNKEGEIIARASFSDTYKQKLESYLGKTNVDMLLESKDFYRRDELLERIYKRGSDLFEYNKSEIYKENYLKMFEGYENLDNYEEVVEYIKKMDSKDFYKVIKEIDKGYSNFGDHYDNRMIQAEFNNFARRLGVKINNNIEPVTEPIDL